MTSHLIPNEMKDPAAWPAQMLKEWNNEHECALDHQKSHREALKQVRAEIDEFKPDAVIVFGDDQYENFKEDIIPPFNIYCMDAFPSQPFAQVKGDNIWGEKQDYSHDMPGSGQLAREIADGILSARCPIAYSYKYLNHKKLTHAFANAFVFLDWEHQRWSYPIIPISVNCYGKGVIHTRGGAAQLFDRRPDEDKDSYLDTAGPAGPTPRSCFQVGQSLRDVLDARPERFVVMASSGWSHAFLTEKNHWLYPDREFDLARRKELEQGNQKSWADLDNDAIDDAGCQEFKNWICLAGVVPERTPRIVDYLETWIFNSQKCFAVFPAVDLK